MASSSKINVRPQDSGLLGMTLGQNEAIKVSELLQKDVDKHHVFFNASGFHDHIIHHLLTLYGTGASTKALQDAYDHNAGYQLKAMSPKEDVLQDLQHGEDWTDYLGKGRNYATFLRFFQREIERIGWQKVVSEYVFKDDARALNMQSRLFGGLLHPLIQLLYAMEWEQPELVATALAQTAVHEDKLDKFLTQAAEAAASSSAPPKMMSILGLYDDINKDNTLKTSARWEDEQRIFDGVLKRGFNEIVSLASRVRIDEEEIEERTVEMAHASAYVATAAAFHPPHVPKFDFFLMHHVTSAPFFLNLMKQSWVPASTKAKLLENKIRMDLVEYAARGCAPLNLEPFHHYTPKDSPKLVSKPEDLFPRFHRVLDDGHTVKLARALVLIQRASRQYKEREWIKIKGDGEWLKSVYVLLDANENTETMWVRAAGYDQAWKDIPKMDNMKL